MSKKYFELREKEQNSLTNFQLSKFCRPESIDTKELSKNLLSTDSLEEQFNSIKPNEIIIFNDFEGFIFAKDKNRNILDQVAFLSSSNENFSLVLADKLTSNDKDSMLDLTLKNGLVYQNIFSEDPSFISEFGEFKEILFKELSLFVNCLNVPKLVGPLYSEST